MTRWSMEYVWSKERSHRSGPTHPKEERWVEEEQELEKNMARLRTPWLRALQEPHEWMGKCMDGWMKGWVSGWMDEWMGE